MKLVNVWMGLMALALALAFTQGAHAAVSGGADGDPYPLDTCPVSGQELGSMGDPVVAEYDGREVRFCCAGCTGAFEDDKEGHWEEIDAAIKEQQMPHYPLDVCLNSDQPLDIGDGPHELVYKNRLTRFCCTGCRAEFKEDPEDMLAKLDEAVVEQQLDGYATENCVVDGGELGSMGEPINYVVANRLVRLCCAACIRDLQEDPLEYLSQLDE